MSLIKRKLRTEFGWHILVGAGRARELVLVQKRVYQDGALFSFISLETPFHFLNLTIKMKWKEIHTLNDSVDRGLHSSYIRNGSCSSWLELNVKVEELQICNNILAKSVSPRAWFITFWNGSRESQFKWPTESVVSLLDLSFRGPCNENEIWSTRNVPRNSKIDWEKQLWSRVRLNGIIWRFARN